MKLELLLLKKKKMLFFRLFYFINDKQKKSISPTWNWTDSILNPSTHTPHQIEKRLLGRFHDLFCFMFILLP